MPYEYKEQMNLSILIFSLILVNVFIPTRSLSQPLAYGESKFLGCSIGSEIPSTFSHYWNQVTAGNAGKWGSVEFSMDSYNWNNLNNIYNYAINNEFEYKHHTLVWGSQQPSWIESLDSASQRAQVEEWIRLVGENYPDMDYVDVVNEPFNAPPSYSEALGGSGETGWDWVVTSFELARQYCAPGVKLILNEYNVLHSNSVTTNYLALIDTLMVRGLIDGIGIQGHYFEFKSPEGGSPSYSYSVSTIKSNLDRLTSRGLPVYITEFDINEEDDEIQLENYKTYFPIFWEHLGVEGITLWGYVIYDVWKANAFLIDERRAERPALQWLRTYILSPPRPIIISPSGGTDHPRNPVLSWGSSASAISYNVQVSSNSLFTDIVVDTSIVDTVLQLNILEPNKRYFWHVSASNDDAASEFSSTANFVTGDQITAVEDQNEIPKEFRLMQNYPNPFNPSTVISYEIPSSSIVNLAIYDLLGRRIITLVNEEQHPGRYTVTMNAENLASGIYYYRISSGSNIEIKKMLLLK